MNNKKFNEIELLINQDKLQEAIHKINDLVYYILVEKNMDYGFIHDIGAKFIDKGTMLTMIEYGDNKVSKKSEVQFEDVKDSIMYYWKINTKYTFKVYEVTKEKITEVLNSFKNFVFNHSIAI